MHTVGHKEIVKSKKASIKFVNCANVCIFAASIY